MSLSRELRRLVWERDEGICGICSLPVAFDPSMHVDHVTPTSAGGPDTFENLRATHGACNMRRGDGRRQERMRHLPAMTSIRVTPSMRDTIRRIAENERRTTNGWIRIVLEDAVKAYLAEHPELAGASDERPR